MTDLTTTASPRAKIIAATLAFAAALALVWASLSPRWAIVRDADVDGGFGLRAVELCEAPVIDTPDTDADPPPPPHCERATIYSQLDGAFPLFGWIASVAIWIGAAALAAAAAMMLAGRFIARPIALTTLALVGLAIGLVAGLVFLAVKPQGNFGPGPAFWAFVGGSLVGLLATILVARIRPKDPEWDDPQPFDEDKW